METIYADGKITICRNTSNIGPDTVSVQLSYENKRIFATLSMEDYAYLTTGLSRINCSIREDSIS